MTRPHEIAGIRFGRLLAVSPEIKAGRRKWLCQCDCGRETHVQANSLVSGTIVSCGCYHKQEAAKLCRSRTKHGEKRTRLYQIWYGMKQRCHYPKNISYRLYGARGIEVCPEWRNDYPAFAAWARSAGYADNLSIDRIDSDAGYSPDNCRWVTVRAQSLNRSTNRVLEHDGMALTIGEWAKRTGIHRTTIAARLSRGMSVPEALLLADAKLRTAYERLARAEAANRNAGA